MGPIYVSMWLYRVRPGLQSHQMGNRQPHLPNDNFERMIADIRRDQSRRVSVHPEKKYLLLMAEELERAKMPSRLKQAVADTLRDKLSEVELIQCISCINALKNNEFDPVSTKLTLFKEKPQSKNVRVVFGQNFLQKMLRNLHINVNFLEGEKREQELPFQESSPSMTRSKSTTSNSSGGASKPKIPEGEVKDRLKNITAVMKKELHRISHPFGKLNKAFAEFIEQHSGQYLPLPSKKEEPYQKALRVLIADWCTYLESSCLSPYRKWIINYTGIQQGKYGRWLRSVVIQQIWAVNNGYLFSMLATVIQQRKIKLQIDARQLQYSTALLTPSLFRIDPKLQIEGHFFDSIYEMSEVVARVRPEQVLAQLETVKKRICTDIDNYHRLVQRGEVFEIDSDNILSIVSYILCKIGSKIDQIHTHLIFLRIVYGDTVYYSLGLGSYMLSTIFGAFQFLQTPEFAALLTGRPDDDKPGNDNNHSQTKGTLSQKEDIESKGTLSQKEDIDSKGDRSKMHVGSLVLNSANEEG